MSLLYDPPGVIHVRLPWLSFDRLVESAFEQIRLYAKFDVAVSLRMLRALGDIAATIPDLETRQPLVERGRRIVAGCAEQLGEDEMGELCSRFQALEGTLPTS